MSSPKSSISAKKIKNICFLVTTTFAALESNAQTSSNQNSSLGGLFLLSSNVSITETWTDNISLANGVRESGWISTVSPGLALRSTSGRIKGNLNYSLNFVNYSNGGNKNSSQNSLNSNANIELIDGHGYIDLSGVISQQTISAFSVQSNSLNAISNPNRTEVSTYSISPYYKGNLSSFLSYQARHRLTTTSAKNANAFSTDDSATTLNLNSDNFLGKLSWGLDLNQQSTSRVNNPDVEIFSLNTSLRYPLFDKFSLSVSAGRQNQNYSSVNKVSSWTSGAGLNWSISDVTKISASMENNPLGKMHSLNFEHRTPRTSWRVSDVKSVSLNNTKNSSSSTSNFDLLFNQFASIEPDINKRIQLVNNYMLLNGISSSASTLNGYLTSGTSVQRAQNISFALLGIRDTITLTATRSNGKRIATTSSSFDDFSNSGSILQEGISVAYTHRLTENTVVSNQISKQKTQGDTALLGSEVKSINLTASTRIGQKTNFSISARHSVSSGSSFPYKETAVTGSLAVQF